MAEGIQWLATLHGKMPTEAWWRTFDGSNSAGTHRGASAPQLLQLAFEPAGHVLWSPFVDRVLLHIVWIAHCFPCSNEPVQQEMEEAGAVLLSLPGGTARHLDPLLKEAVREVFTAKQGRTSRAVVELREALADLKLQPKPGEICFGQQAQVDSWSSWADSCCNW